ncbi:MAG: acetylglutamate kinase [Bdellovibrionales bacterium RIFOXYD12_FULL_39_22]|nr:MAG: acetylglutamate kinase [Bdellovibrionales bacterium RIFOXYB1_FULL_39_21]OFZ42056.1 MAG: acetylglutamate kinase [Bdellovibrionales bacterium RIFOXYC12_FULL_39_17]OFZ50772.1 MAG: acetylglutamate kinase [Bdellovibrionales bacterium RIFOXYC1_FULL_39_130]OFZ77995.1 MAG: acetylglutamate kinase [Bdellovibrionales bacterium RIFOXYD1_FULL_39_84]OFZ93569.1 MAG: acetylglutamate kinase [Bdellovibrionales bacterium RIFOXYD12_FULL_39_22]HLE10308.1 acetylglutamate kinase [Bacteriovoracaceae bacterium
MRKKILIKFGGEIVENEKSLENLALSLAKLFADGHQIILVHGGGPLATALSKRLNIEPKMVGGRRVTCKETLEVMKMTLPGIINSNILAMLKKHKLPAVAVSAISFINASLRPPKRVSGSNNEVVDFGFVGDIKSVDPALINFYLEKKLIPVISPLCADDKGNILNINADTVATATAEALEVDSLVMVTQVGGIFEDIKNPSSKMTLLSMSEASKKIAEGIISGGMIPKVEECNKLFEKQLSAVHIVGVNSPDDIANEIAHPGSVGTTIVKK